MPATSELDTRQTRRFALADALRQNATLALGTLTILLGLALRLYRLGAQSLWLDEGGTWAEVTGRTGKGWLALLGELFSADAAYPLYHILLKGWVALAGDSEWALRFPSALASAATVAVLFLAAREIEGRRQKGKAIRTPRRKARSSSDDGRWTMDGSKIVYRLSSIVRGTRYGFDESSLSPFAFYLLPALLFATAPFALWYAQDAKVYSLLMLAVALDLWALLRALRRRDLRSWLLLAAVSVACLFVHRLALLALAGAALAVFLTWPAREEQDAPAHPLTRSPAHPLTRSLPRIGVGLLALGLAAGGVAGTILAVRGESRGAGGHIPAGAFQALWLTAVRFALDRWPGDIAGYLGLPLLVWLLPCAALTLWGLARLVRDALARRTEAVALLCMFAAPLALFALALALMTVPIYEARYATVAFPAWVLVLAYPFREPGTRNRERAPVGSTENREPSPAHPLIRSPAHILRWALIAALLIINGFVLVQPQKGLFSGDPLKEQWREGIAALAADAHPDDLLILHPYYVQPLWDYYAPRVTTDALPQPVTFPVFAGGDCYEDITDRLKQLQCIKRNYNDPYFNKKAYGKKRALLLIAPDHAKMVDPPPEPNDEYGWLGLRFQFSNEQRAWACGDQKFIGVEVMCQSYPSTFNAGGPGEIPQPAIPLDATFGSELHLRGYSLDLFGGAARRGGTLPVTLYWDAARKPARDYAMFLHLCRDCSAPPLAQDDGPPLGGDYSDPGRTTTWQVGDPVHDERSLVLPDTLAAGRYTLLLGVYPRGDAAEGARLPVTSASGQVIGGTRLVLGEVVISVPQTDK